MGLLEAMRKVAEVKKLRGKIVNRVDSDSLKLEFYDSMVELLELLVKMAQEDEGNLGSSSANHQLLRGGDDGRPDDDGGAVYSPDGKGERA